MSSLRYYLFELSKIKRVLPYFFPGGLRVTPIIKLRKSLDRLIELWGRMKSLKERSAVIG